MGGRTGQKRLSKDGALGGVSALFPRGALGHSMALAEATTRAPGREGM